MSYQSGENNGIEKYETSVTTRIKMKHLPFSLIHPHPHVFTYKTVLSRPKLLYQVANLTKPYK